MELQFSPALKVLLSESDILVARIALSAQFQGLSLRVRPLMKGFADSGKWSVHTAPIHTPLSVSALKQVLQGSSFSIWWHLFAIDVPSRSPRLQGLTSKLI